jgi:hypothetical protein
MSDSDDAQAATADVATVPPAHDYPEELLSSSEEEEEGQNPSQHSID